MDLGVVIDVALGMIFMWIALSLATIQIQEWIMTRLDKRAKDMESSMQPHRVVLDFSGILPVIYYMPVPLLHWLS